MGGKYSLIDDTDLMQVKGSSFLNQENLISGQFGNHSRKTVALNWVSQILNFVLKKKKNVVLTQH